MGDVVQLITNTKKYELTDEIRTPDYDEDDEIYYRIRALKSFNDVKKGDLGGWVESEDNLSQDGNCWIYDDAIVFDHGNVSDDAQIRDNAIVIGIVEDDCVVSGDAYVEGMLSNGARIGGDAYISGCIYSDVLITKTPIMMYGLPKYVIMYDEDVQIGGYFFSYDEMFEMSCDDFRETFNTKAFSWNKDEDTTEQWFIDFIKYSIKNIKR